MQQAPRKKSSTGGVLLLVGGLGCLGLLSLVCVIGAGFYLAGASDDQADLYGPVGIDEAYGGDDYGAYGGGAGGGLRGTGPVIPTAGGGPAVAEGGVERYRVPVTADNATRGPGDALVTVVEFGDFQCPFCARATDTMEQLEREYPGQLRFVFKHNPLAFHTDAEPAAHAALEARAQQGDAAFWAMHDRLYENTRALSRADLERHARQQGLDVGRLRRALDQRSHAATISADQELARQIGATGTPTFYINGRKVAGAQPVTAFRSVIDEELRTAQQLLAGGTPRARIYEEVTRDGRTTPAPRDPTPSPGVRPTEDDPTRVHRVPIGDSPQLGPEDALVTVVVFSDFQCPFCARVTATLDQVRENYGDDVRLVFKHNPLPFHQRAMPAAQAAVAVQREQGDQAFWRLHDILFENQRALEDADLQRYARRVGASGSTVGRAVRQDAHRARIQQDVDLAAELGARGTPSFFINGKKLVGAQPFPAFQQLIDAERASAQRLVAAGTPRGRVYETIMAGAR